MCRIVTLVRVSLGFLLACLLAVLLVTLRYILSTPQPLDSTLPGEARLYKWQYGYVYYKVAGPVDAPALVLFHALRIGASGYEMRYLIQALAQDHRVYTLDLLGFGLSDHPDLDYTAELYITLYQDFLREIVQQPAILLASGLSCNYCVAVADSTPALCQQLILIAPIMIFAASKRPAWLTILASNKLLGFVFYAVITSRPVLRIIVNQRHGPAKTYPEITALNDIFAASHQFSAQHAPLALLAGKLDLEVMHRLLYLTQPVQMIWGKHSALALPRLPFAAPQIHVDILNGCGIFPHEEQPETLITYIRDGERKIG